MSRRLSHFFEKENEMILNFNAEEKKILIQALSILRAEYDTITDAVISPTLRREFSDDALRISNLAGRIAGTSEQDTPGVFRNTIQNFLNAGQKISAIKYVREQKGVGLKEAKDYVELNQVHVILQEEGGEG